MLSDPIEGGILIPSLHAMPSTQHARHFFFLKKIFNLLTNTKNILGLIDKKRNNLAHANSNGKFEDIKKSIKELIINYEKLAINRGI